MGETRKYLRCCVLALLSVAACGGDDDGNGGVVTGLPAEQKLSTLSDADVKKACQSVNDRASAVITPDVLKRALCAQAGATFSVTYSNGTATADVDKCQEFANSCINSTEVEQDDGTDDDIDVDAENDCEDASAADLAGCEATVGEYESCINAVLSKTQQMLAEMTCQNAEKISSEEYSNDEADPAEIPQCQVVMTKCPDTTLGIPTAE